MKQITFMDIYQQNDKYPEIRRISKNAFFLDENKNMSYAVKCNACLLDCKQSYRAKIICCPKYKSKNRMQKN